MELAGEVLIGVAPQKVWAALNDADVLRRCIPGCEEVRQVSPTETHTRVLLKMGPVRARFVGKILMSDVRPGEGCTLNFEGSGGAAGFARGSSVVSLIAQQDGTRLQYSASASIGGKLGQIGGRMIDASAKQMADQFFGSFRSLLDGGAQAVAPGEAGATTFAASTQAALPAGAFAAMQGTSVGVASAGTGTVVPTVAGESIRVLWFVLGMASTGFGVWLAGRLAH
ncbi:MAG: carbon monoxide dehydrogenase subunit G [Herminiimonas sp.]|nr:carbon monoxide dehydrogenase subunit G [Herminiimonas sp.]